MSTLSQVSCLPMPTQRLSTIVKEAKDEKSTLLKVQAWFQDKERLGSISQDAINYSLFDKVNPFDSEEVGEALKEAQLRVYLLVAKEIVSHLKHVPSTSAYRKDFLHTAANAGLPSQIRLSLQSGISVNIYDSFSNNTPLMQAVYGNQVASVEALLQDPDCNLYLTNPLRGTAWTIAADYSKWDLVRFMVQDPRFKGSALDVRGFAPIHYAAFLGMKDKVKTLLAEGNDINMSAKDPNETPLQQAIKGYAYFKKTEAHMQTFLFLFQQKACKLKATNSHTVYNALALAAHVHAWDLVKYIVEDARTQGVDLDKRGFAPIHYACCVGSINKVADLIEKGCDINLLSHAILTDCYTPLHQAARGGHIEVISYLLAYDTCNVMAISKKEQYAWTCAHQADHKDCAKIILADPRVKGCELDSLGLAPIHYAAIYGMQEKVQALLADPSQVNLTTSNGETPLHCALRNKQEAVVHMLIDNFKCDVSAQDKMSNTPWKLAKDAGLLDVMKKLPADPSTQLNQENSNGPRATPLKNHVGGTVTNPSS